MSQPASRIDTQSIQKIFSPTYKAVSCIPIAGIVSSLIAEATLVFCKDQAEKIKSVDDITQSIKTFKEYGQVNLVRNLLTIAMIVGGISLGILSGPVGGILVGLFALNALQSVCQIKKPQHMMEFMQQNQTNVEKWSRQI